MTAPCLGRGSTAAPLSSVGDDEVLERLEERRRQELPPGVRHWLGGLTHQELRIRWDEVTRGWPEPWFARRGRLERVDAFARRTIAKAKPVSPAGCGMSRPRIWWNPAFGAGGAMKDFCFRPRSRRYLSRVAGRQASSSRRTAWPRGPSYFVGSGPYPETVKVGDPTATSEAES